VIGNAIKFVPANTRPRIAVRTELRAAHVRLWIEDNGIGIKPEHQKKIWGMFERVHPDSCYEGTGIGLAVVRKAAERMGGSVGVSSDGRNGSKFWIQLPAASAEGVLAFPPAP
jgi:signal transduction histidine kinase